MTANFHIPLAAERQAVAVELQGTLVDLLDLALIGKHLHWNVEGRHFRTLHDELDEHVAAWRKLSDEVAERATTIGTSPDGQAETIAGATQLEPLPAGHLSDEQVLKAIGDRVAAAAKRARERIDRVAVADPVTCELFVKVSATLEKQLWMIRAQVPAARAARAVAGSSRAQDANGASGSGPRRSPNRSASTPWISRRCSSFPGAPTPSASCPSTSTRARARSERRPSTSRN